MSKYYVCVSRYIINSVFHLICRSFGIRINAPFVLKITAIQKICSSEYNNGNYHHQYSTHKVIPLFFLLFISNLYKKTPLLSFRTTKAELSVVPLCIIVIIANYNHLLLSTQNILCRFFIIICLFNF